MASQFEICILPSKAPLDGASCCISRALPGIDLGLQDAAIGNASVQTLATKNANLDLRHVQPARVFGCVVELDSTQEFVGSTLAQNVIEALPEVRVEVVQHQVDTARLGVNACEQFANEGNEVARFSEDLTVRRQFQRSAQMPPAASSSQPVDLRQ